ncbi:MULTISPECIES: AAA family ATPase [Arenibacter]|uniref:AAA family ATPase n=1 Tax=Arenibacter TaxID=178469 RepID=UPI0004DF0AF0|nr:MULTISPECIES: AAA family ATPase [Arenibacter]GBF22463.1 hypothetical protein C21_04658 [Arenibacter sp. NBRC 103722]|tara:strand:- start:3257 stop:5404 length:2148 start_codon:yes stop_codon:yes gene_type:complete
MRLAAIFIPNNSLPYIFGKEHQGQTINFGGKYLYEIDENEGQIIINERKLNEGFINKFWGDGISLVSAIVGRNGTGKTTILRAINQESDIKHISVVHIFEEDDKDDFIYLLNETTKAIESQLNIVSKDFSINNIEKQYYSPVLDYELQDTHSAFSLVYYAKGNLEEHYYDSITRNILFLNEPVLNDIKKVYPDFPAYDKYFISILQHSKSYFRKTYIDSNLGNPNKADVSINYVNGEILRIENDSKVAYPKTDVLALLTNFRRILEGDSFTTLFQWLWELDEYKSSNEFEYTHDGDDFIKNLEVTLLSYIILGAVFPQTGLHGGFDLRERLLNSSFSEKLDILMEYYLSSTYQKLSDVIKTKLEKITIDNKERIVEIINEDKFESIQGVKTDKLKERMKRDLDMFWVIKDFYEHLKDLIINKVLPVEKGRLVFNIVKNDISIFTQIVDKYKRVLESFQFLPITPSIVQFKPNKKLSSGEKSLIDFYASLNNYVDRYRNTPHQCNENYLLLLDEPELGYHPLWKKKFIKAITATLPILFSKIKPTFFDTASGKQIDSEQKNPNIQIVFTTHDPLTLSDIPNQNIIYLDKEKAEANTYITDNRDKKSFGANVHDLLADSFFLDDGFMGEFAERWIKELINYLSPDEHDSDSLPMRKIESKWSRELGQKVINIVDEPMIKERLQELYNKKFIYENAEELEKKISEFQILLKKLKDEKN